MSALGKLVRDYLVAQTGYAATLPGGLTPETNPQGGSSTYATYQGLTRQRVQRVDGTVAFTTERIQITAVAPTRAAAQTVVDWIATKLKAAPSRTTISGVLVHALRVDDQQDQAEVFADGGDDPARTCVLDVIGSYEET